MRFRAIVQNVVDGSFKGKNGEVSQDNISVVEIGADACVGALTFQVHKGDAKVAAGDQCECVINGLTFFNGQVRCSGSVSPLKK